MPEIDEKKVVLVERNADIYECVFLRNAMCGHLFFVVILDFLEVPRDPTSHWNLWFPQGLGKALKSKVVRMYKGTMYKVQRLKVERSS